MLLLGLPRVPARIAVTVWYCQVSSFEKSADLIDQAFRRGVDG
ncbi:hypothetical protein [Saccharopolyspora sp. NPDC002376]